MEARGGHQVPRTGVTDGCELSFGCWGLNPDPPEEEPVLLNTELFL